MLENMTSFFTNKMEYLYRLIFIKSSKFCLLEITSARILLLQKHIFFQECYKPLFFSGKIRHRYHRVTEKAGADPPLVIIPHHRYWHGGNTQGIHEYQSLNSTTGSTIRAASAVGEHKPAACAPNVCSASKCYKLYLIVSLL